MASARPGARRREWTDAELLDILDRKAKGESNGSIAARHRATRSTIAGLVRRCRQAPSRHDGTMPPDWWREGLTKQTD